MRTIFIALGSALLLAFIVIQLNVLFFADDQLTTQHHLALLVLTIVALFINGLFNARLALRDARRTGRGRDGNRDHRNSRGRDGRDRDSARRNNARDGGEKTGRGGDRQRDKKHEANVVARKALAVTTRKGRQRGKRQGDRRQAKR